MAVGLIFAHPAVVVSSIIGLWFGKLGTQKYSEHKARQELINLSERFCKVTNNLNIRYEAANQSILEYFQTGDRPKLFNAVSDLLNAKGKEEDGTLDMLFNEEAKNLSKLRMVDLPDENLNVSSWVNVLLTESVCLSKS